MDFKPLHIPARDKSKGQAIWCGKCNRNITTQCGLSGKKKSTCKHADQQRFQTRAWDKVKKRTVPVKTFPKELREYDEFNQLHLVELKKFKSGKVKPITKGRPTLLRDALNMYADWLNDIDPNGKSKETKLPSQKIKNLSPKYIKGEITNLLTFKESQPDYLMLEVEELNEYHVGIFHDLLENKEYAPKTYNNKIASMRQAFEFMTKQGYNIKENPFSVDEVMRKAWEAKKDYIELEDFYELIESVTPNSGIVFERTKNGVKRKDHYRDWLTDYWMLCLLTGGRSEDVSSLKWSDVKKLHVEIKDYKSSDDNKKKKVVHWIPRGVELNDLLVELRDKYGTSEGYLIEPNDNRRKTIANQASKSFTTYWRKLDKEYWARLYSLRKVHGTLMALKHGQTYSDIFGMHKEFDTTLKNYANYEKMIGAFAGKPMFG